MITSPLFVFIGGFLCDYGPIDITCWVSVYGTVDDVKKILKRMTGIDLSDMAMKALDDDGVADGTGFWDDASAGEPLKSLVSEDGITLRMLVKDSRRRLRRSSLRPRRHHRRCSTRLLPSRQHVLRAQRHRGPPLPRRHGGARLGGAALLGGSRPLPRHQEVLRAGGQLRRGVRRGPRLVVVDLRDSPQQRLPSVSYTHLRAHET